jgi:hypothetical protein
MRTPKRVKTEKLSISLPVWLAHAIDEDAQNRAATRSQVIKDALMAEYQKNGQTIAKPEQFGECGFPLCSRHRQVMLGRQECGRLITLSRSA